MTQDPPKVGVANGADIEHAGTGSFASRLKAQAQRARTETKDFVLLAAEQKGDLTVTITCLRVVDGKDIARSSRQGDAAFLVEATDSITVGDGIEEDKKLANWSEMHTFMELPGSFTNAQVVRAVVGGNEVLISSVAGDILSWMSAETERAAAQLGK